MLPTTSITGPLAAVATALLIAGPALRAWAALRRRTNPDYSDLLPTLFDVNTEGNVPTWFASGILLLAAVLAAVVASLRRARDRPALRWIVLAAVLATMSLDEAASLHERVLDGVGRSIVGDGADGWLRHAWLVPGIVVAAVLAAGSLKLARDLPGRSGRLLAVATGLYFLGAIGFESASGQALATRGDGPAYVVVTTLEEGAELAGALLLLHVLLDVLWVRRDVAGFSVSLRPSMVRNLQGVTEG